MVTPFISTGNSPTGVPETRSPMLEQPAMHIRHREMQSTAAKSFLTIIYVPRSLSELAIYTDIITNAPALCKSYGEIWGKIGGRL